MSCHMFTNMHRHAAFSTSRHGGYIVPPSLSFNVNPPIVAFYDRQPCGVGLGGAGLEGWGKVGRSQQTYLKMIAEQKL